MCHTCQRYTDAAQWAQLYCYSVQISRKQLCTSPSLCCLCCHCDSPHPYHTPLYVSHGGRCNTTTHWICMQAMATMLPGSSMLPTLSCFLREHEAQAERSLRLCPPATAACPTRNTSGTQSPASLHQVMLNTEADTDKKKPLVA